MYSDYIKNFFDGGFYLNLDKNPDRRKHAEEQLAGLGWSDYIRRFSGFEDHKKEWKTGHLATSLGSKAVVSYARTYGYRNVLFFQDDFEFVSGGQAYIYNALKTLENIPDWEIIYFGGIIESDTAQYISDNLIKVDKMICVHAIGINGNTFDRWNNYIPTLDNIDDEFVRDTFTEKYAVYPLAVTQYRADSQDGNHGQTPEYDQWIKNTYKKVRIIKK